MYRGPSETLLSFSLSLSFSIDAILTAIFLYHPRRASKDKGTHMLHILKSYNTKQQQERKETIKPVSISLSNLHNTKENVK